MAKSKHRPLYSSSGFRLLLLTTVVALSLLGLKNWAVNYQNNNVLGESSQSSGESDSSDSSNDNSSDVELEEAEQTEKPDEIEPSEAPEQEHISSFSFENLKELRVRTEENKIRIRLDSTGGRFELRNEDGKLKIKAREHNGQEFELETETLDDINKALEEEDIHLATASGNRLRIRRGLFEAETHFPLSINPTTNTLTVTTPAGEKDVAVLPDQAVENLLRNRLIDRIASGSAEENPTGIKLGLLGNNPVFQILGVDEQKLLGFIPISINKVSFVSAENGQIIKVDATFLNRLLDFLSIQ